MISMPSGFKIAVATSVSKYCVLLSLSIAVQCIWHISQSPCFFAVALAGLQQYSMRSPHKRHDMRYNKYETKQNVTSVLIQKWQGAK